MAEVHRVPLGRSPAGSWLPRVVTTVAILLAVLVVKPWELGAGTGPDSTPGPTFYLAPEASRRPAARDYDPRLFGLREPDPGWELWPAGYVVEFGIAGPVTVHGQDDRSPPPDATDVPPGPTTSAAPASPAPPTPSPMPDHVVDLGQADHLVALGINTPLEVRVQEITLYELPAGQPPIIVPIVRLPTLWDSTHFIVIAPEDVQAPGQPAEWKPGLYRIDLTTGSRDVREVLLFIHPPGG